MRTLAAVLTAAGLTLFAAGCGGQDSGSTSSETPPVSSAAASQSASDAPSGAARSAEGAVGVVSRCLDLARQKDWVNALTPCTQAARQAPDDLEVEHALQQAQAAAANAAAQARGVAAQSAKDAAARESSKLIDKAMGQ